MSHILRIRCLQRVENSWYCSQREGLRNISRECTGRTRVLRGRSRPSPRTDANVRLPNRERDHGADDRPGQRPRVRAPHLRRRAAGEDGREPPRAGRHAVACQPCGSPSSTRPGESSGGRSDSPWTTLVAASSATNGSTTVTNCDNLRRSASRSSVSTARTYNGIALPPVRAHDTKRLPPPVRRLAPTRDTRWRHGGGGCASL